MKEVYEERRAGEDLDADYGNNVGGPPKNRRAGLSNPSEGKLFLIYNCSIQEILGSSSCTAGKSYLQGDRRSLRRMEDNLKASLLWQASSCILPPCLDLMGLEKLGERLFDLLIGCTLQAVWYGKHLMHPH